MTKDKAIQEYRALVAQYGLRWTAAVPREAYDMLDRINEVLSEDDRREALGLPKINLPPDETR